MKPLYRFDFDTVTGKVIKHKITDYEKGKWTNRPDYFRYRYRDNSQMRYCYKNELDRFKSNRVYSFSGDLNRATEIIFTELENKKSKAFKDYKKYEDLLGRLHNDEGRSRRNNKRN